MLVFLASDEASLVSGATYDVTGGDIYLLLSRHETHAFWVMYIMFFMEGSSGRPWSV
jgi:hypothetical protein